MPNKKTNPHAGHRSRLRKQFIQNGAASFYPHQLLELLLFYPIPQKDTNDLAHALLERFESIDKVFEADVDELATVEGMGLNTALFLKAAYDVYAAYGRREAIDRVLIDNPFAADAYYSSIFRKGDGEQFAVTVLDENSAVFYTDRIESSEPTADSRFNETEPVIRRILETLVKGGRKCCIVAHYMPSPERPDGRERSTVGELLRLLEQLNIKLVQYYYICDSGITEYVPSE